MANTSFSVNNLLQGGALFSTTVLATGCNNMDTSSTVAVVSTGLAALGVGAYAAHRRLSQLRQSGASREALPLTQREIPDDIVRANLSSELSERYPVLGDAAFAPLAKAMATDIFQAWHDEGRLVDTAYPDLRGCVTESTLERKIDGIVQGLQGAEGAQRTLREGLERDLGRRSERWAPRNVEGTALAFVKSAYPAFDTADYSGLGQALAKNAFQEWIKGSPSLMNKPGPATPLIESFVHGRVRSLMEHLSQSPGDKKLTALLRELQRSERRRSMESPTLFRRLQRAARELEILKIQASQVRLPNEALQQQLNRTVGVLREAPEVISKEELDRYASLEGKESDNGALRELTSRLPVLQEKLSETRRKEEAILRERLVWLQKAVRGPEAAASLDVEHIGPLHPALPEWAREMTLRTPATGSSPATSRRLVLGPDGKVLDAALGVEIVYRDGGYWLRDARGLSRLHPSNWLRAFFMNGLKISAGGGWPVRSGDRLKIGVDVEIEFDLPEEPTLERLRGRIARITSLEDLARLLRENGQRSFASQIEAYLEEGEPFSKLSDEGGLQAKVADLVLRREAARLHDRYFLGLPYAEAEIKMIALAKEADAAASIQDLAKAVRGSFLADRESIAQAILRLEKETIGLHSFEEIPDVFGFRAKAVFFAQEVERKLRAHIAKLDAKVSKLSGELRDATSGIANRDQALTAAATRESEVRTQFAAAREALVKQEKDAREELVRLRENHAAALQREENIRTDLIEVHKKAQTDKDTAHRNAATAQETRHTQAIADKNLEMQRLKDAHAEKVAAQEQAHAEALAARDRDYKQLEATQSRDNANKDATHRQQLDEKKAEYERDIAALRASHAQVLRELEEEHQTALDALDARRAEQQSFAEQWKTESERIETLRATAQAEVDRLTPLLAQAEADLVALEAKRAEQQSFAEQWKAESERIETLRAAAQAEVDRLTPLLAHTEGQRDRYRGERNMARASLQTANATLVTRQRDLETEESKVRTKDIEIANLTQERNTAQSTVRRLESELADTNREFNRLTDEELPKQDRLIAAQKRELKDIQSALTDFDHHAEVYLSEASRLLQSGAEIAAVQQYLDKLIEVKADLDKKLAVAGAEIVPEAAAPTEAPVENIPFEHIPDHELEIEEDAAASAFAGPDEVTRTDIKIPSSNPPPPPAPPVSVPQPTDSAKARLKSPFFGGGDPRTHKIDPSNIAVNDKRELYNNGRQVGLAWICAGSHVQRWQARAQQTGEEAAEKFVLSFRDGSLLSGKTSAGTRDYQEDGVYMASYELPDGRTVKIIVGVDGAGGMGGGDVVSSAFLQSIHAVVLEAAEMGRADLTAEELFAQGEIGANKQKNEHGSPAGTGAAGVIVILGGKATIATKGDAMVVQGRRQADNSYRSFGYSNVQHMESLGNDILLEKVFKPSMKSNPNLNHKTARCITGGVAREGLIDLYTTDVLPGDQFLIQSDGGYGNTLGSHYKVNGSREMKQTIGPFAKLVIPELTQTQLNPVHRMMELSAGRPDAAHEIHDVAVKNQSMRRSGNGNGAPKTAKLFGVEFELPNERDPDNVFSILYQQGDHVEASEPAAAGAYRPLEVPGSDHFGGADPRLAPVEPYVNAYLPVRDPSGASAGGAVLVSGGADHYHSFRHPDGSLLSARTSAAGRPGHQQDGYYLATYNLPDGTPVKVLAVSDGAGGAVMGPDGHKASSSFKQGVHARVVELAEKGWPPLAGDLFAAGEEALLQQRKLGAIHRKSTATGTIVVIVGNTATAATLGDSTLLHAKTAPDGTVRTDGYSAADYMEIGELRDTGLINGKLKPHLYFIDNLGNGDFFVLGSDAQTNIHGSDYKISVAGQVARDAYTPTHDNRRIGPANDNTFLTMNQLLGILSGQDGAAIHLHDFTVAAMARDPKRPPAPISVLNGAVTPPAGEVDLDNAVFAVIQHAVSAARGIAKPDGYGPLEQVLEMANQAFPTVDLRFLPQDKPAHGKHFIVGRGEGLCDGVIPHNTVSPQHAHLAFNEKASDENEKASGEFEANTWYLQPIKDSPDGTHVDAKPVRKEQWVPVRAGSSVMLGGVPLLATVGVDFSLRFQTHPVVLAKLAKQAAATSTPPAIPPMPPVPAPAASRRSPPPLSSSSSRAVPPPSPSRPAAVPPPMPSDTSPTTPPASRRPSGPPTMDAHGNIFMQGAVLVHLVASSDPLGTVKEVKPGVYSLTVKQNGFTSLWTTDQLASTGWDQSGKLFIESLDGSSVILPSFGPEKKDYTLTRAQPFYIEEGKTVVRVAKTNRVIHARSF